MQKPRVAPEKRPSVMSATLLAHALAVERGAWSTASRACRGRRGALVADDEHLAFLVGALLDGLEAGLFAIEAARRAGELQRSSCRRSSRSHRQARDCPCRPTTPPVTRQRLVGRTHDVLVGFHFTLFRFSAMVRPVTVMQSPCR